ncbi:MAG: cache domain-containing protein, partial [Pseudomonadota bacterium]
SYLAEAAQKRDEAAILASVEEYQNLLTFDLAVVMDRNGVVLTRTDSRSATAEDLSTTPLVAVALEESKASGVWQQGEQLYHAVAVPLVRQFELVGYIAVAYAINDTLAVQTERAGGAETVFLASAATGPAATASTLDDGKTAALIDALRRAGDVLNRVIDRGETASNVELDLGGERWVAFLSPLRDAGGNSIGAVVALTSVAEQIGAFELIRWLTAGAAFVAAAFTFALEDTAAFFFAGADAFRAVLDAAFAVPADFLAWAMGVVTSSRYRRCGGPIQRRIINSPRMLCQPRAYRDGQPAGCTQSRPEDRISIVVVDLGHRDGSSDPRLSHKL